MSNLAKEALIARIALLEQTCADQANFMSLRWRQLTEAHNRIALLSEQIDDEEDFRVKPAEPAQGLTLEQTEAALEATRDELAEARDALARALPETRKNLGAKDVELTWDAARRVVAERDEARLSLQRVKEARDYYLAEHDTIRTERDTLKSQLAARDELLKDARETLVPFAGIIVNTAGHFERARSTCFRIDEALRPARDASQKAGA